MALGALIAAGCAETPRQHTARLAVERFANAHGRGGSTRCTSNPRLFFMEGPPASVFVCIVKTGGVRCDRYVVRRHEGQYTVTLRRRDGDCVLPET